jgi:S-adenosylmethionine decarboxylase
MPVKRIFVLLLNLLLTANILFADEYLFSGKHFIASYLDCDAAAIEDNVGLRNALLIAAKASKATVLDYVDYEFNPQGFTMAILLSESHATIHTYPEHRACFVDLFTCGEKCSSANFDEVMRAYLKPAKVQSSELLRSDQVQFISGSVVSEP